MALLLCIKLAAHSYTWMESTKKFYMQPRKSTHQFAIHLTLTWTTTSWQWPIQISKCTIYTNNSAKLQCWILLQQIVINWCSPEAFWDSPGFRKLNVGCRWSFQQQQSVGAVHKQATRTVLTNLSFHRNRKNKNTTIVTALNQTTESKKKRNVFAQLNHQDLLARHVMKFSNMNGMNEWNEWVAFISGISL